MDGRQRGAVDRQEDLLERGMEWVAVVVWQRPSGKEQALLLKVQQQAGQQVAATYADQEDSQHFVPQARRRPRRPHTSILEGIWEVVVRQHWRYLGGQNPQLYPPSKMRSPASTASGSRLSDGASGQTHCSL